jgi:hypothetical protein
MWIGQPLYLNIKMGYELLVKAANEVNPKEKRGTKPPNDISVLLN